MKSHRLPGRHRQASRSFGAFTRINLLAVIGTGALVVLLLLTSGWSTVGRSRQSLCFNRQRELSRAWLQYAADHDGKFVGNLDGGEVLNLANSNRTWMLGWLDFAGGSPPGANTNLLLLTEYSPLSMSRRNTIGKCPCT